jgi:DGQHR domain-containing protein
MDSHDLVAISWADVRHIAPHETSLLPPVQDQSEHPMAFDQAIGPQGAIEPLDGDIVRLEDESFEQFLGIQRELSPGRVAEIQKYVTNVDATFPTGVLLAVSHEHARYNEASGTMTIVRHSKAAKIIDGQHRIAGLRNYAGNPFQMNVAVFVDMDIQDQAMVFATINLKQTKVNKSLAYDLYEFTKARSPQRTCHDLARFLNYKNGSPFKDKIKMLGVGSEPTETITQATFVDRLLRYISRDPMTDRNLIRKKGPSALVRASGSELDKRIFRNLFIDGKDTQIASILWNYFRAVNIRWPRAWSEVQQGNILNRTTGFGALMRFLRLAYIAVKRERPLPNVDAFLPYLQRVQIEDMSFSPDIYLPGSSGEKLLFEKLVADSGIQRD